MENVSAAVAKDDDDFPVGVRHRRGIHATSAFARLVLGCQFCRPQHWGAPVAKTDTVWGWFLPFVFMSAAANPQDMFYVSCFMSMFHVLCLCSKFHVLSSMFPDHVLCAMLYVVCSMFYVLCSRFFVPFSMFIDSCSMFDVLNFLLYVVCSMLYAPCSMPSALWSMVYVLCFIFYAPWCQFHAIPFIPSLRQSRVGVHLTFSRYRTVAVHLPTCYFAVGRCGTLRFLWVGPLGYYPCTTPTH